MAASQSHGPRSAPNQFESGMAFSPYPVDPSSLPEGFPSDAVVDLCVVVPSDPSAGPGDVPAVSLTCLYAGPEIISAVVSCGGEPVLCASVRTKVYEPYTPVPMVSLYGGFSGSISFGDLRGSEPRSFGGDAVVSPCCVVSVPIGRLTGFVDSNFDAMASGVVGLDLPEGVSASASNDGGSSVVTFSADEAAVEDAGVPCDDIAVPGSVVTSVNGVRPDDSGRVAIVFAGQGSEVPE